MIPWDERYGTSDFFYGTEPNDFLRERHAAIPSGGTVLCLGEGEGRNAVYLAARGYRVVALDQSAKGLEKARRLAADQGVAIDTVIADLDGYRIEPAAWDGIVSIWCHLPSTLRMAVHRQAVTGLRPGGAFLLEAYTPDQLGRGTGGPKSADLLPTLAQLRNELAGLRFVHALESDREVREGRGHTGSSATVQVVALCPGS
jgi:SAM-dependent methyltransferase